MPILKTNILGSEIEINFQNDEKKRLYKLINVFKERLGEFNNLKGKYTDNKIYHYSK